MTATAICFFLQMAVLFFYFSDILLMRSLLVCLLLCYIHLLSGQKLAIDPLHPTYWTIDGQSTLLIGGSVEDNLFQLPYLDSHLDSLVAVGGNYVRNVMSSRDEGNVWPFQKTDSLYDLRQWNPEYWRRFEHFLEATSKRKIIVQLEIWATFDYYRDNWEQNPFNPQNNSTYTAARTKLPIQVPTHPTRTENDFFRSIPAHLNQAQVLAAQQRFVNKILSYTLHFDHILYCIDNETSVPSAWGTFWSRYIRMAAREQDKTVYITEMWDPWELSHPMHDETLFEPEVYDFMDISQNNHNSGDKHWNQGIHYLERMHKLGLARPVNTIKTYGGSGRFGSSQDGVDRLWRSALMGVAAVRLHRPPSGNGLNALAQVNIQSLRMLADTLSIQHCLPNLSLLQDRSEGEAYCSTSHEAIVIYFPKGGEVSLRLEEVSKLQWLNISESIWMPGQINKTPILQISTPTPSGQWTAVLWLDQ